MEWRLTSLVTVGPVQWVNVEAGTCITIIMNWFALINDLSSSSSSVPVFNVLACVIRVSISPTVQ